MQVEGLALAVGGREVLRELLEQGKPVLAAHGPYTAAGDSRWEFLLKLIASVSHVRRSEMVTMMVRRQHSTLM